VDRWGVRFKSDTVAEEISADRIEVEWSEKDERIYVTDTARPELKIYMLEHSILSFSVLPQFAELENEIRAIKGKRELSRRVRILGYFFAAFICITWLCSLATGAMVRSLAAKVPRDWEQRFGDASMGHFKGELSLPQYSNQVSRLTAMAEPLLKVVPLGSQKVKFYIVENSEPNACALPGGYVIVNTGLLELTDHPEELLGVIAHELAHVTQRHYAQHMISSAGPLVIFGVFFSSKNGIVNLLGEGSGLMVAQGFSQKYETEADEIGWNYLVAANVNPHGMIGMFEKFKTYESSRPKGIELTHAFDSHPALDKRIVRLERKWKKLSSKTGFVELPAMTWTTTNTSAAGFR
jgi:Zn-dependent protease with chaperone function